MAYNGLMNTQIRWQAAEKIHQICCNHYSAGHYDMQHDIKIQNNF